MSPSPKPEQITLNKKQVETGILMYLKEVRGIRFEQVTDIRFPAYTQAGDPIVVLTVQPEPGHGAGV